MYALLVPHVADGISHCELIRIRREEVRFAMFAKSSFLTALGVEVFASGQRRWPDHVKTQAVSETLEPGATVSGVAARYEIMPSQLTACRRLAKEGKLVW